MESRTKKIILVIVAGLFAGIILFALIAHFGDIAKFWAGGVLEQISRIGGMFS